MGLPMPKVEAAEKDVTLEIRPHEWEEGQYREVRSRGIIWREYDRWSGNLKETTLTVTDVNGAKWQVAEVRTTEEIGRTSGQEKDKTRYTVKLVNQTRATADFTGYQIAIMLPDGTTTGTGNWEKGKNGGSLEETYITGEAPKTEAPAIIIRIWDTYEPSLKHNLPH